MSCARLFASRSGSFAGNSGRLRSCVLQACVGVAALCGVLIGFAPIAQAQTAAVFSGVTDTLGSGFSLPLGVAVDGSGNVYVADSNNNAVKEIEAVGGVIPASPTILTLGSGFSSPYGVAVDGSGNVYVADTINNAVKEMTAGCASSSCVTTLGSGFHYPYSVAVDRSGNVYVADWGNHAVKEIEAVAGAIPSTPTILTLGSGFSSPSGVAVDGSGNVYVADNGSNAVKEIEAVGGAIPGTPTILTLGIGFNLPSGIAVDGSGNVYVGDWSNDAVKEIEAVGGAIPSTPTILTLGSGFRNPSGVAVDGSGNVYVADDNNNAVKEIQRSSVNFGSAAVAATTPVSETLSFTFTTGGTIGTPVVMTQGAIGLDFTDTGGGTCTPAHGTYYPSDTCTVIVKFTPKRPGLRLGVVQLTASGVIATANVYGVGIGPLVTFPSNLIVGAIGNGFSNPTSVAVDASGDVFVADVGNNTVNEIVAGSSHATPVSTGPSTPAGFSNPSGVAVDGGGNVFVADRNHTAVEEIVAGTGTAATGTINLTSTVIMVSGFSDPAGVAVDGAGDVFVADGVGHAVREIVAGTGGTADGTITSGSTVITVGSGFIDPGGVAVDASGNVFVADYSIDVIMEIVAGTGGAASGTVNSNSTVNTVGSGISHPAGVAVDASGNVFVADYGTTALEIVAGTGGAASGTVNSSSTVITLASGFTNAQGVALDASGNVFVADYGPNGFQAGAVKEIDLSDPPSLIFAQTIDGETSAVQTVTVANTGNAPLTFPIPTLGNNPSIANYFTLNGGGVACPQLTAGSSSAATLAENATCTLAISFTPTSSASGTINGSMVLTDNNLNASPSATQTIPLTGTAEVPTTSTTVKISPSSLVSGQTVTFTATVTDPTNGGITPTGSVTFTDTLGGGVAVALNGGTAVPLSSSVATLSGVTLSGTGTHTITASYSDGNGGETFQSSIATGIVTVSPGSNVGIATSSYPVTLTFTAAGFVGSVNVLTQGTPNLDFTEHAAIGDPWSKKSYNIGDTCTVNVIFTPRFAGPRYGAVVLEDKSGNVLATAFLENIGTGPQIAFGASTAPATAIVPTGGLALGKPTGFAMDGAGDLFIADIENNRVVEMPAGGGVAQDIAPTVDGRPLDKPAGIAVDGAGDLFIADVYNWRVVKVPAGGGPATAIYPTVDGKSLNNPVDIALDGAGNLFISDTWNNRIVEVFPSGAATAIAPTVNGTNLNRPSGIAVDGAGNLFIADTLNARVVEVPSNDGAATSIAPAVNNIPLNYPSGITVDGAGDLFIADTLNNRVVEVAGDGSGATAFVPSVNGTALVQPNGLALDGAGNLFVSDHGNSRVVELQRSLAPALSFASTAVGAKSSDSPQSVVVENTGNSMLTFSGLSVVTDFPLDSSGASVCTATTSLAAGAHCSMPIDFIPVTIGAKNESLTLTDNSLNVSSVGQNIQLIGGTATPGTPTLTWPIASAIIYGQTLASSTLSGGTSATAGTFTWTTVSTAPDAGTAPQSVTFTPTDTTDYTSATQTVSITVNKATQTVTAFTPASPLIYGVAPVTLTATPGSSSSAVAFSLISGPATLSGSTLTITGAGTVVVAANQAGDTNYAAAPQVTASITVNKATQTVTAFTPASPLTYGVAPVTLTATPGSSSSLVVFSLISGPATLSGSTLTITGAGTVVVAANQASDTNYAAAPQVTVSLIVDKATLTVTPAAASRAYGAANPTFTGSITGLAGADSITATYASSATATTIAGTYSTGTNAVTSTLSDPGSKLGNYTVVQTLGALTITQVTTALSWSTPASIAYGTALSTTQLNATSGGVAGTFVYTPALGTILGAGSQTLSVTFTPTDTADYSAATGSAKITVSQASALAVVTSSANPVLVLNAVTLTAKISLASLAPTGSVTFLDGTTPLGSATLTGGTAVLTTSGLAAGSHAITVVYGGDGNFVATTSAVLTQLAVDFTLAPTSSNNGGSATAQPGGTALFSLTFTPTNASTWPATVTFSTSGLPAGASVTFSPQTLVAGSSTTAVTMTVQVAQTAAILSPHGMHRLLSPIAMALLLLPFGAGLRRGSKNLSRMISLFLLAVSVAAVAGLSGCGTARNSQAQNPENYSVIVTATSGALSHSSTVVLTVE